MAFFFFLFFFVPVPPSLDFGPFQHISEEVVSYLKREKKEGAKTDKMKKLIKDEAN